MALVRIIIAMERRPLEQLVMSPERKMHAKGMNTPSGSGTIGIHCNVPLMLENGGSISRRQDERHIGSNGPPSAADVAAAAAARCVHSFTDELNFTIFQALCAIQKYI